MNAYFFRLIPFTVIFLLIQTMLRVSLLLRGMEETGITSYETVQILLRGLWFDLATTGFVLAPLAIIHLFTSGSFWNRPLGRMVNNGLTFLLVFSLLFDAVAEHLFWSEFNSRFNFIAVDYLVYTQEVIGNIRESYPLGWLITGIFLFSALCSWVVSRYSPATYKTDVFKQRARAFLVASLVYSCIFSASNISQAQFNRNIEASEIAGNGIYNLFNAFWDNEINYERFYTQHPTKEVQKRMQALLAEEHHVFENEDGITRIIRPAGLENHKNVIVVVMESMSAAYMQAFGNEDNITPNLDRLAKEGLFFTKTYATGTRTVRGLEAVTLSVPPTPGQSIVRRKGNDNLFSLGFVFKDRGYDTKFIYGGYGYFDNMNNFFAGNGFSVLDRTNLSKEEMHFANIWGVADDDIFARTIKEADRSAGAGKPFMYMVMTTSNHRPYSYPDNRIDIPSKSSRLGGVKYADYSVGKLIEWAKEKPWFKDTVFVFVADHTAGSSGKVELDPKKYHIPMIFYAPGFIKPARYEQITSQIDLGPSLLGKLNFHYRTKFYGEDVLQDGNNVTPRAFISNYQKVALVKHGQITILSPKRHIQQYSWLSESMEVKNIPSLVDDTVAYYQSASWWYDTYRRAPSVIR